jgi:hypothetical protein
VALWAKPTSVFRFRHQVISSDDLGPPGYDRSLLIGNNNWEAFLYPGVFRSPWAAEVGQWQHVVLVYEGSNVYMYFNGAFATSNLFTGSGGDTVNTMHIGTNPVTNWNEYFHGVVDDVRVYNRALTAQEVRELYAPDTGTNWMRVWGTSASDSGGQLVIAGNGDLYLSALTKGPLGGQGNAGRFDQALVRLTPDGIPLWTRTWGAGSDDLCKSVFFDDAGHVWVAGDTTGPIDGHSVSGETDFTLARFTPNGAREQLWIWGTPASEAGFCAGRDAAGNMYYTGITRGELDGHTNPGWNVACLQKFDSTGARQWTRTWGSSSADAVQDIAVTPAGDVYICGYTQGLYFDGLTNRGMGNGTYDAFLTKFNSSGAKQWTRLWGSTQYDEGIGVALAGTDTIYVAGRASDGMDWQQGVGSWDLFLTKFSADGTKHWTKLWGSTAEDTALGLTVAANGNVYVVGYAEGAFDGQTHTGGEDACICGFTAGGARFWTEMWGEGLEDRAGCVVEASDGSLYVAGHTTTTLPGGGDWRSWNIFIRKFAVPEPASFTLILVTLVVAYTRSTFTS